MLHLLAPGNNTFWYEKIRYFAVAPVVAGAGFHQHGDPQFADAFHFPLHQRGYLRRFFRRAFQHEFVMHLQQQSGLKACQGAVDPHHGEF